MHLLSLQGYRVSHRNFPIFLLKELKKLGNHGRISRIKCITNIKAGMVFDKSTLTTNFFRHIQIRTRIFDYTQSYFSFKNVLKHSKQIKEYLRKKYLYNFPRIFYTSLDRL